jgi:hypothetical protein
VSPYRQNAYKPPPTPPASRLVLISTVLTVAASLGGCAWWTANGKSVVQGGLEAAQIACVLSSEFTSAPEIVTACQIDKALTPFVEQLLAQKAVQKARASMHPADAGAEAGQ